MSDMLVFNHHCLPFPSARLADAAMPEFLKICQRAFRLGRNTILLGPEQDPKWFQLELAPDYHWRDWHREAEARGELRDQIRAFRSIATRQPFLSPKDIADGADLPEVLVASGTAPLAALQAACWHSAPVTSFPTQAPWNSSPLEVCVRDLDVANDAVVERGARIVNLHALSVLDAVGPEWEAARADALRSGREIWKGRRELFPGLEFCGKAESQLCGWSHGGTVFAQVKDCLGVLGKFAESWRDGTVAAYSHGALTDFGLQHRVSGESESCAKDAKRRAQRTFHLPDGEPVYFENHAKLAQGFRIHFYPDEGGKVLFVGYIGRHLD